MQRIFLCGNPNSGKSTLFNRLCGAHRRTGNFAGVTVDTGEGRFTRGETRFAVVDLPGLYSLGSGGTAERVAADALLQNEGVIVNVIDAAALERGLRLTAELAALGRPMVLALNMADELEKRGVTLDIPALEGLTGLRAVKLSAKSGAGIGELVDAMESAAPPRVRGFDAASVAKEVVTARRGDSLSDKIDRVLLRPYIGLPLAFLLIAASLALAFGSVGSRLNLGFDALLGTVVKAPLDGLCEALSLSDVLHSFLVDGAAAGVLGVLGFLPQIALLFFCLSVFEDSGLAARMAFLCDSLLRRFGLSGRAFFPLCVGFGCTVPAVMAARITEPRSRRILFFCLPFISCPARAPVYALLIAAFFPGHGTLPMLAMYFAGLAVSLLAAAALSRTSDGGAPPPFVMELPPYRLPAPRTLFLSVWDKCRGFIVKAGTLILLASAAVWFLQNLGLYGFVSSVEESFLYLLGSAAAKFFLPLGFGNATAASALLLGFFAKETIVSTFGVLAGGQPLEVAVRAVFTPQSALAFMVFSLLYTPCAATVAVIRRESGSRRTAAAAVLFGLAVAYAFAWLTKCAAELLL